MIVNQLVLTITNKGNQAEMNINLNTDNKQSIPDDVELSKKIQEFLVRVAKGIEENVNATRIGKDNGSKS